MPLMAIYFLFLMSLLWFKNISAYQISVGRSNKASFSMLLSRIQVKTPNRYSRAFPQYKNYSGSKYSKSTQGKTEGKTTKKGSISSTKFTEDDLYYKLKDLSHISSRLDLKTLSDIFNRLNRIRFSISKEKNTLVYLIASNTLLHTISLARPRTINELLLLPGVSSLFATNYGNYFLSAFKPSDGKEDSDVYDYLKKLQEVKEYKEKKKIEKKLMKIKEEEEIKLLNPDNAPSKKVSKKTDRQFLLTDANDNEILINLPKKFVDARSSFSFYINSHDNNFIESLTESQKQKINELRARDYDDLIDPLNRIDSSELNSEQALCKEFLENGKNFFITGGAGTGKSFLLRYIIQELYEKYGMNAVAVTAPTGIAAINIGGQTIQSFSGFNLDSNQSLEYFNENVGTILTSIIDKISKNKTIIEQWFKTKVIIIDEISMLHGYYLQYLDYLGRIIRNNNKPFGGIQVILAGDFMQLPPVSKNSKDNGSDPNASEKNFCFQLNNWNSLGFDFSNTILLTSVFRQKDIKFVSALNEIRLGYLSDETKQMLETCSVRNKQLPATLVPTKLHSFNKKVNIENNNYLSKIKEPAVTIKGYDETKNSIPISTLKSLTSLADNYIPLEYDLKVGSVVMLIKNTKFGDVFLANGSRGVVVDFSVSSLDGRILPIVQFNEGKFFINYTPITFRENDSILIRNQIPLKLAWVTTIHKSQGLSLSQIELSLENIFAEGQAYVALSRVKSLEGLWITSNINKHHFMANKECVQYYYSLHQYHQKLSSQ